MYIYIFLIYCCCYYFEQTVIFLHQTRIKKKSYYFIFSYPFFSALPLYTSKFLNYIIFLLSKELLLTFSVRKIHWQQIPPNFVFLRKILFYFFTFEDDIIGYIILGCFFSKNFECFILLFFFA